MRRSSFCVSTVALALCLASAGCTNGSILGGDGGPIDATVDADATLDLDASAPDATDARRTDARRSDAAGDVLDESEVDAGPPPCDASTCGFGRLCRRTTTSGACVPRGDAARCPPGTMANGDCCTTVSETYDCVTRPIACVGGVDCTCASTLCTVPGEPAGSSGCFDVRDGVLLCYHAMQ